MKGKLLRGITGSIQPRRLLHGYQDAVFAWSGENPFANLAQSSLYKILPRSQYNNNYIISTEHGQAFKAPDQSSFGGYLFSSHVPSNSVTYARGVAGYSKFVYTEQILSTLSNHHLSVISSLGDGNTNDSYSGVLTFGMERYSGNDLHFTRIGSDGLSSARGFAGGTGVGATPINIPLGSVVTQAATFDPVSRAFAGILQYNDVAHVISGFMAGGSGFGGNGSSILLGGYNRYGNINSSHLGMLEAAVWNRYIPIEELVSMLQQPSIFQPTEFILPFSFGDESSGGSEVINSVPEAMVLSSIQAGLITTEILNTQAETLILAPVAASIQTTLGISTAPVGLSIAGIPATLHSTIGLAAIPENLVLVANSATFAQHSVVNSQPDALILQPVMAGIYAGEAVVDTSPKALTLTPDQATIVQHGVLATAAGNIGLQGVPASLSMTGGISIPANPAIISMSGVNAGIVLDSGSVNFGTSNTSRYFLTDAMSGMDLSGDFSIVAVISPDYTVSNRHKYFFSTGFSGDPAGLNLYLTSNNGLLSLLPGNGVGPVSSAAVPPGWCLVYARRIAGVLSVGFVDLSNGTHTKSNTPSSSGNFSNDVAVIGGRFDLDATRFFTGGMSWIALLETGLSDGQIESIAAGTTGLLNDFEPSVVELWDMTFNRSIQPGVVHGINAERFGDGWGVGGGNPLPYEIDEAEIISAIPATIGLTGVHASVHVSGSVTISAIPAIISLHGFQAELLITNVLATNTANVILSGTQAGLYITEILSGNPASITLQGNQALIPSEGVVDTWPDSIGIFGQKADISMRTMLATNPASMVLASMRAQISYESPFVWGSTTIEARLQSMTIEARQ